MEKSKRVVGYARVSTEAQDITRQIELITAYCSDRNYHLIKIIQEKISGARKDRKSLNELLDVDDAVADMIIVSELSRLSREDDILSVLSTINYNRGIQMYRFPNSDVQKSVIFEGIKKRLKIV